MGEFAGSVDVSICTRCDSGSPVADRRTRHRDRTRRVVETRVSPTNQTICILYPVRMSDTKSWQEYTEIAEKTLNRCNLNNPREQTIHYVAVMLCTESKLADLEEDLSETSPTNPIQWFRLRRTRHKYAELSSTVHGIQKTTSKPDSHLHDLIGIDEDEIDEKAINQILTQLGWEFFPRHLNRFLNLYERVGRELDSKKQQLLTTCILLVSFVAVLVSTATLVATVLLR